MNFKKIAVLIVLSLVLLSTVNTIYADDDREYNIIDALIDLAIDENGLLHVNESYTYSFDGTFNGVYRDIPLKDGESIENLEVYIDGAYGEYEVIDQNGQTRIKVYLWADKAHNYKIHDQEVTVSYSYDMKNVVTLYNDIGSLQYKLWGENWECEVLKLTSNVKLPGDNGNQYYLNPEYYNLSDSMNGDTIHVETKEIPSGEFYELQVLMPLDDFSNATYAKHVNVDGKEQIMQKQAEYKGGVSFWGNLFNALSAICFISPLSLVYIYLKHGREPKVNYEGIYERELPTDDPPAVVNAMINNRDNIGKPDMKGFEATIMDLIDRKVFKIHVEESEHTQDLILEFDDSKYDELSPDEKKAYGLLKTFGDGDILNVSRLSSKLNNETNGKLFVEKLDDWKNTVYDTHIGDDRLKEYFNNNGDVLSKCFTVGGIVIAVILFLISLFSKHPAASLATIAAVFLGVISFALIFLPEDIFGQWTPKGRLYYLKWKNFKKFLSDNSLIKEHPPESIVIWNKYLVYGTALGVADKVYESMKLNEPRVHDDDYYYGSDLYMFHSYAGLSMLNSAFNDGVSAANPSSDGGGFGGVGGGSGGGGGGAF
ncbi:DUF2207 domain-containing protein [Methanobrevibacter sp.]|uniref:DUF2207 domain-containing protein n=1 Tax=Methanobrevibacter sp. TaxID=66852 RepID=UPI00388E0109